MNSSIPKCHVVISATRPFVLAGSVRFPSQVGIQDCSLVRGNSNFKWSEYWERITSKACFQRLDVTTISPQQGCPKDSGYIYRLALPSSPHVVMDPKRTESVQESPRGFVTTAHFCQSWSTTDATPKSPQWSLHSLQLYFARSKRTLVLHDVDHRFLHYGCLAQLLHDSLPISAITFPSTHIQKCYWPKNF